MPTYKLNEMKCPACAKLLDGATNAVDGERSPPQCGDLTVCSYCATMLQFVYGADGLDVRRLTINDLVRIGRESQPALAQLLMARAQTAHEIRVRQKESSRWN